MTENVTAQDVLDFWFGPIGDPDHANPREAWFEKNDAFDERIRAQFGAAVEEAQAGGLVDWVDDGLGSLGLILMLDQFTRNLYRGSDRSFMADARARELASGVLAAGGEQDFTVVQRVFLYLPFEHSENMEDQHRSMALYRSLPDHPERENWIDYAHKHFVIIERFGRFPHRNEVMGRVSTDEEVAFLTEPNSSF